MTREERCSFPVGTDRPARRRPAALDRPVTPVPFAGPAREITKLRVRLESYVLMYRAVTLPILGISCQIPLAFSSESCSICASCISPRAARDPHAALHHPPVHPGYHPPSRRFAAAVAALRAAAACMRSAHAALGTPPSRVLPEVYRLLHGPARRISHRPSADFASPLRFLVGFPGPRYRSEPPSDQSGVRACPDDRRQKPQSQLLLLLTAR